MDLIIYAIYICVAAGEATPWKESQILILIFLFSLEVSFNLELKETLIFLQFVFIYALLISALFTLYNTYHGGVLILILPIEGIKN